MVIAPDRGAALRRVYRDARTRGGWPASARSAKLEPTTTRFCVVVSAGDGQPMVDGVTDGLGPGSDLDLVEDVRQMPCDRAVADEESLTDLPVGTAVGHEGQHVALAPAEPVGRSWHRPGCAQPSVGRLRLCSFRCG